MPTQVWFIRHGEVEAPFVGTFVGSSDIELSDIGHHQAEAIAAFLKESPIDAVYTSPKKRAKQTAAPLAKALGQEARVIDDLAEMHFGQWEGLSWEAIAARDAAFAERWQQEAATLACPGGEAANEFAQRALRGLSQVLDESEDQTIAIFSHAGTNRAFLAEATGMPYMDTFCFAQDYGCVNAAMFDGDSAQIALLNVVPGPESTNNGDGGRDINES